MAKDDVKTGDGSTDEVLSQRVEAMMNLNQPDPVLVKPNVPTKADTPEIDIFKDTTSAPKLPPKLMKEIEDTTKEADAEPIKVSVTPAGPKVPESNDQPVEAKAEVEPAPAETADVEKPDEKLNDPETDKAVSEIVAKEGDEVLAVEDARTKPAKIVTGGEGGFKAKLAKFFKSKKTWAGIAIVLLAVFAVPYTRYTVLGLALKGKADITVVDGKTGTPVSNAVISFGGATAKTDNSGQAKFSAHVGNHTLKITKQYYTTYQKPYFVGFSADGTGKVYVAATGRQIPVTVLNSVTSQPLANAEIKIGKSSAKTNALGKAVIVVPINKDLNEAGTITLSGYNPTSVTVKVTDQVVAANTFKVAPAGQVYFLSNKSGKIDLVKTNLDGSGRKVILPGTGNENPATISLLASRDWKYLVLESTRDNAAKSPALYLVDTSNDNVTKFESSDSSFQIIGWQGHNFLYSLTKNQADITKAGRQVVKSYDADQQQSNLIAQSAVKTIGGTTVIYENFNSFYSIGNELIFTDTWNSSNPSYGTPPNDQQDTITAVSFSGQNRHDYATVPSYLSGNGYSYFNLTQYEPNALYFQQNANGDIGYYKIEDGKSTPASDLTATTFNQSYPTFLFSPTGKQTFWTEYRDGKNTLFLGDDEGKNSKQLASLSDYSPYGWYSDKYLLVTKNASELYIMPAGPLSAKQQPVKISDYYKPQQVFRGYGGGYGGL